MIAIPDNIYSQLSFAYLNLRHWYLDIWTTTWKLLPLDINGLHDDVIIWIHFPRYWPFVRGIHRWPVNSPYKGQWRGALMFFYLRLNRQLSKQWRRWRFETLPRSLWRHCNDKWIKEIWRNMPFYEIAIMASHDVYIVPEAGIKGKDK